MKHNNKIMLPLARLNRENYFTSMTDTNLAARSSWCPTTECAIEYVKSLREPTRSESKILETLVNEADKCLLPFKQIHQIPWKILIAYDYIESGFPHTHFDCIILPKSYLQLTNRASMINTLIHEKVHVYQRLHPCETNILFTRYWKFNIVKYHSTPKGRANPDINKLLYADEVGKEIVLDFDKTNGVSIRRTIGDTRDHPYEMMAYIIAAILGKDTSGLNENLGVYVQSTQHWIDVYLF